MTDGAVPLSAYPSPKVVLQRRGCDRGGRFDKAGLVGRVGGAEVLPVLRLKLAAGLGCELARRTLAEDHMPGFQQCGAHYPELLSLYVQEKPSHERGAE